MVFLGNIYIPSLQSVNNRTTSTPFDIGRARKIYLVSDTDGVFFAVGPGTGVNNDTFTAGLYDAPLFDAKDPYVQEGPFDVPQYGDDVSGSGGFGAPVHLVRIAIFNPTGTTATVQVYAG
jgi:hypothetical protein